MLSRFAVVPSLLLSALLVLSGCATEKKEYKSDAASVSTKARSLEVPPDLITPTRDDRYSVPEDPRRSVTTASAMTKTNGAVQGLAVGSNPDQVGKARIVRAGSERWLVVPGTAQALWPQLRKFWEDLGFTIKSDSPQLYIMETDWAERRARTQDSSMFANLPIIRSLISNAEREKFRTRLESSQEPGMIEIYVTHRGLEETDLTDRMGSAQTAGWKVQPANPDQEIEMLRRMMVALGSTEAQAKVAAAVAPEPSKVGLVTADDGVQQLVVNDAVDRVWRQVGVGLDRVGMVVEDRDRARGIYFVRYITDEDLGKSKDSSWFSWMAFWRSNEKKPDTDQYRIVVKSLDAQKTTVRVQDKSGAPASAASAKQILTLLNNELK